MAGEATHKFSMQLTRSLTDSDRHVKLRSVHHCLPDHTKFHIVEDPEPLLYSKGLAE